MSNLKGLIYKTQPYLEHSLLLFVYTPRGKKTLVANGILKQNNPLRVLAQYLNLIEFNDKPGQSMFTLTEAKIVNDYANIKGDYDLLTISSLVVQIINKCLDGVINDDKIFSVIEKLLDNFSIENTLSFALKMIVYLGFGLNLTPLSANIKGYNMLNGCIVDDSSNLAADYELPIIIKIVQLLHKPFAEKLPLPKPELAQIKRFIEQYYLYHLETKLI